MKKVFLYLVLLLICTVSITGCDDNDLNIGDVPLTDIKIEKGDAISVNARYDSVKGQEIQVSPVPANATDVNFEWSSDDTSVAIVTESEPGKVLVTVCKVGSTIIRVSSGKVTKEIPVVGKFDVTKLDEIRLELDEEPTAGSDSTMVFDNVSVGDVLQVKASANPRNANTETADFVIFDWKTSNPAVATVKEDEATKEDVDKIGTITIVGKGKAEITISSRVPAEEPYEEPYIVKAKTIIVECK
jgi:uncharacterized protein YjdB